MQVSEKKMCWYSIVSMIVVFPFLLNAQINKKIISGEYYWNDSSSTHYPLSIPIEASRVDLEQYIAAPETPGKHHTLFVRFKDSDGKWGGHRGITITVEPHAVLSAGEYFLGDDPGKGEGISPKDFKISGARVSFSETIATTGLSEGQHTIFVRLRDRYGNWGPKKSIQFTIQGDSLPKIHFSQTSLDFGMLKIDTSKTITIRVQNLGLQTLSVDSLQTNQSVFEIISPKNLPMRIRKNDPQDITIKFTPTQAALYEGLLSISSNDPKNPQARISLEGQGVPLKIDWLQPGDITKPVPIYQALPIVVKSNIDLGSNGYVTLYYKEGGKSSYDSLKMEQDSSTYSAQIPASAIRERGIMYYIKASDGKEKFILPDASPPVLVDNAQQPQEQFAGETQNAYRMISIPFEVDNPHPSIILSNFGNPDTVNNWRLFRLQTGNKYVEYFQDNFEEFKPGRGYWFITKRRGKIRTGNGKTTVPLKKSFKIDLQAGWNMIGNPYNFPVDWKDVKKSSQDIIDPYAYNGLDYTPRVQTLSPWEGYLVFNNSNQVQRIDVSPQEGNMSPGTANILSALPASDPPDENAWQIQLIAESGLAKDAYNFVGVRNFASSQYDTLDLIESPRQIGEYLKLYFPHDDWPLYPGMYGYDFRGINPQGYHWDFEIHTNSHSDSIFLSFPDLSSVPENFSIVLIDQHFRTATMVRSQQRFALPAAKGKEVHYQFRLLIGRDSYITQNNLGLSLLPAAYVLSQNHPNPFNLQTTIRYSLPFSSRVQLEIYNMLGQRIKQLVSESVEAGYHQVLWDGKNDATHQVSSGIYFYRLIATPSDRSSTAFVETKKILLLK